MVFALQPLRIPGGWIIDYHNFTEYDREIHGDHYLFELNEDLLQLSLKQESPHLVIDLGWYPSHDATGHYMLFLIKDSHWDLPLAQFVSRSKQEIIEQLEKWTCYGFYSQYL